MQYTLLHDSDRRLNLSHRGAKGHLSWFCCHTCLKDRTFRRNSESGLNVFDVDARLCQSGVMAKGLRTRVVI